MKVTKNQVAVIAASTAAALGAAGVGFAYWSASGSGTGGTAGTALTNNINLSFTTSTVSGLAPGTDAQAFTTTIHNNNANSKAQVNHLYVYLTVEKATNASSGTCDASDYTLDGNAADAYDASTPFELALASNPTVVDASSTADDAGTDTIGFNDKTDTNQDGCKGATVTFHYSAS